MVFKHSGIACAVALLVACGSPKPREAPAHGASAAAAYGAPVAGPDVYRIDAAHSEVRVLVHRAGAMARLGHNHVIVDRAVGGWVRFSGDPATATFSLRVPVAQLVVDEAPMRTEEGADFSDEVTDDVRSGTRRNMLGAALLDGENFPAITLTSVAVAQRSGALLATMTVSVAGHESTLVAPFTLETSVGRIAASGIVTLRQSALGLTPFSVLLGALQVQDELTVKFKLLAVAG